MITVLGAGVAGLATAVRLAERGARVEVLEASERLGSKAASWLAGGMLAPCCEAESADASIVEPGLAGIDWWEDHVPGVSRAGTLVVAPPRDAAELRRFAARTSGHQTLGEERVAALEPDLAGRFRAALFFAAEAHLDPRRALDALASRLRDLGGTLCFGVAAEPRDGAGVVVDCRGFAASSLEPDLRGVRGEMLLLRCPEVTLSRPVRLLHPRAPIYVVPREDALFMVGATMIESRSRAGVCLRSAVDLMNAAYALHPAFAEAEIVEMAAELRPAFPDNLPRVRREGDRISFNGLYRHGFLLAPAFAARAADLALEARRQGDEAA